MMPVSDYPDNLQQQEEERYPENDGNDFVQGPVRQPLWRRKWFLIASGLVVLIVIIAVAATAGGKGSSSSTSAALGDKGPIPPTPEIPTSAVQTNKNALGTALASVYQEHGLNFTSLMDVNSAPGKALLWMSGRSNFNSFEQSRQIQRFVLATFYYATFNVANERELDPTDWASSEKWLSSDNECNWEGIECYADKVTTIDLHEHELSGSLPVELAFLSNLTYLDLTSNNIYMEYSLLNYFGYYKSLETLLMDDNYIVTESGLPASFANLTNLEKIRLSYNIIAGKLDGSLFEKLTKLTYLEVESNYLSGSIPTQLAQLPELVYLYLRRNELEFDLESVIVADYFPQIFSLWLDSNYIGGTIPTAIGSYSALASFSITNTSISGTIPTEIGLLTNLQRVWLYDNYLQGAIPTEIAKLTILEVLELYDNDLSGTIPLAVCNAIVASDYEYKTLTADCQDVNCSCCTKCY